jgi:hypothetical protein
MAVVALIQRECGDFGHHTPPSLRQGQWGIE